MASGSGRWATRNPATPASQARLPRTGRAAGLTRAACSSDVTMTTPKATKSCKERPRSNA